MAAEPDHDRELAHGAQRADSGIEFGITDEADPLHRLARQVAGHDDLDLALHGLGVDLATVARRLARQREEAAAAFQQQPRLAGIARRHDIHGDEGEAQRDERRPDDPELAALDRRPEGGEIEHVASAFAGAARINPSLSGHEPTYQRKTVAPREGRGRH